MQHLREHYTNQKEALLREEERHSKQQCGMLGLLSQTHLRLITILDSSPSSERQQIQKGVGCVCVCVCNTEKVYAIWEIKNKTWNR